LDADLAGDRFVENFAQKERMKAWAACACSVLAVLPVPMAQTGS
jgi:hypothetical protein